MQGVCQEGDFNKNQYIAEGNRGPAARAVKDSDNPSG
jgi:hypothetical protein